MTGSRLAVAGLFAAVFLAALIVTLPASVLSAAVRNATNGRMELANCHGTVWSGTAIPVFHRQKPEEGFLQLGRLQWDVSIKSLFVLQPRISMSWVGESQIPPMEARLSFGQLSVDNLYLPFSASLLGEASPHLRPLGLGGRIIVKSNALSISNHELHGTVTADWMDAHSALSYLKPLGHYRLTIKGAGKGGDLSLDTVSGMLILKGNGRFDMAGSMSLEGYSQAAEGQQEKLKELLNNLGPETVPGRHAFSLKVK